MKFQLIVRVCLIFYTYILRTSKTSGITPWKKCYSLLRAGPAYYRMCSTDVYCSKQTGSSSTERKPSPIISSFLELSEENCRCSQNLWRRRKYYSAETQQTFVNGLLGFITEHFILRWKRVCNAHNNCMICPSIWATLSTLLINILLGSFQLFLHSDQPLSVQK